VAIPVTIRQMTNEVRNHTHFTSPSMWDFMFVPPFVPLRIEWFRERQLFRATRPLQSWNHTMGCRCAWLRSNGSSFSANDAAEAGRSPASLARQLLISA
jgi:hypothetical protein